MYIILDSKKHVHLFTTALVEALKPAGLSWEARSWLMNVWATSRSLRSEVSSRRSLGGECNGDYSWGRKENSWGQRDNSLRQGLSI